MAAKQATEVAEGVAMRVAGVSREAAAMGREAVLTATAAMKGEGREGAEGM